MLPLDLALGVDGLENLGPRDNVAVGLPGAKGNDEEKKEKDGDITKEVSGEEEQMVDLIHESNGNGLL